METIVLSDVEPGRQHDVVAQAGDTGKALDLSAVVVDESLFDLIVSSFTGSDAVIDPTRVSFGRAQFTSGPISFGGVSFGDGDVSFRGASFGDGDVSFRGVSFGDGDVDFGAVSFGDGDVSFRRASFGHGDVNFVGALFGDGGVGFIGASFGDGNVNFGRAVFGNGRMDFIRVSFGNGHVHFGEAAFGDGDVNFVGVSFGDGDVNFVGVSFGNGHVRFGEAAFGDGDVNFSRATFGDGGVDFDGATFGDGDVNFGRATFGDGDVDFDGATFGNGIVNFSEASFGDSPAHFGSASFGNGDVNFSRATFGDGDVDFDGATFGNGHVDFSEALFGDGGVHFVGALFGDGDVNFGRASFGDGDVRFDQARHGDGEMRFARATFGDGLVDLRRIQANTLVLSDASFDRTDIRLEGATIVHTLTIDGTIFGPGHLDLRLADSPELKIGLNSAECRSTAVRMIGFAAGQIEVTNTDFGPHSQIRAVICESFDARKSTFPGPVEISADEIRIEDSSFDSALHLRCDNMSLEQTTIGVDSVVRPRLAEKGVIKSLRDSVLVGKIQVSNVSLSEANLSGLVNPHQLRLDGSSSFARSQHWLHSNRRQLLGHERSYRLGKGQKWWRSKSRYEPTAGSEPSLDVSLDEVQRLYRGLRTGHEASGDWAGANDFYYGEMEMRRHKARAENRRAEYGVLTAYWAVAGYGQRALRAFGAFASLVIVCGVLARVTGPFNPITEGDNLNVWESIQYFTRASVSFTREPGGNLQFWEQWLQLSARLLGPVLLALALLAIRNRTRR